MSLEMVFAYIDPVAGSILLQMIFAGAIGCFMFSHQLILQFFRFVFGRTQRAQGSSGGKKRR